MALGPLFSRALISQLLVSGGYRGERGFPEALLKQRNTLGIQKSHLKSPFKIDTKCIIWLIPKKDYYFTIILDWESLKCLMVQTGIFRRCIISTIEGRSQGQCVCVQVCVPLSSAGSRSRDSRSAWKAERTAHRHIRFSNHLFLKDINYQQGHSQ